MDSDGSFDERETERAPDLHVPRSPQSKKTTTPTPMLFYVGSSAH